MKHFGTLEFVDICVRGLHPYVMKQKKKNGPQKNYKIIP